VGLARGGSVGLCQRGPALRLADRQSRRRPDRLGAGLDQRGGSVRRSGHLHRHVQRQRGDRHHFVPVDQHDGPVRKPERRLGQRRLRLSGQRRDGGDDAHDQHRLWRRTAGSGHESDLAPRRGPDPDVRSGRGQSLRRDPDRQRRLRHQRPDVHERDCHGVGSGGLYRSGAREDRGRVPSGGRRPRQLHDRGDEQRPDRGDRPASRRAAGRRPGLRVGRAFARHLRRCDGPLGHRLAGRGEHGQPAAGGGRGGRHGRHGDHQSLPGFGAGPGRSDAGRQRGHGGRRGGGRGRRRGQIRESRGSGRERAAGLHGVRHQLRTGRGHRRGGDGSAARRSGLRVPRRFARHL